MSTESSDIRDEEGYNTLIELIGDAPSREWIEMYLDWMKKPLDAVGIHLSDDDRFAMTMSPNPGKEYIKGISLLGRTTRCIKIGPSNESVDVLMPDTFDLLDEVTLNSPNKDYDYGGATTELPEGKYYHLNASLDDFVLNDFEDEWLRAAKVELNGKAQKRDAHKHVIYRVVADADARRTALDDAFTD